MRFIKMHGAGNDYIYINGFEESLPDHPTELARRISDRHTGVGSDGLILVCPSERAEARMLMWNADGSIGEMCGNGIRCVAKLLYERGIVRTTTMKIETGAGVRTVEVYPEGKRVHEATVHMGKPIFDPLRIPTTLPGEPPKNVSLDVSGKTLLVTCLSMGNPHCVLFAEQLTNELVQHIGPLLEHHPAFPQRVNVEFVQVISSQELRVRVWERGSGETLACGTGACAATVAAILNGHTDREVEVQLPGGRLQIEWNGYEELFLTGPAVEVFQGDWPIH